MPKIQTAVDLVKRVLETRSMGIEDATRRNLSSTPRRSSPKEEEKSYYGSKTRTPYEGEDSYFKKNPEVAGMAAEDDMIVLNPYSKLKPEEMEQVAKNEGLRIYMRQSGESLDFDLTPEQLETFKGTAYGDPANTEQAKRTIVSRILTGDPSAGIATGNQKRAAERVLAGASGFEQAGPPDPRDKYGSRPDGTRKSTGFLGSLQLPDGGVATEFSTQSDAVKVDGKRIDFPSLVPSLTEKERNQMVEDVIPNKKQIPESIMQKSIQYAKGRLAEGKGVFYDPDRDAPHQDIERSERDVPPRNFQETRSMGIEKAARKRFQL